MNQLAWILFWFGMIVWFIGCVHFRLLRRGSNEAIEMPKEQQEATLAIIKGAKKGPADKG